MKQFSRLLLGLWLVCGLVWANQPVKLSSSGLCHTPESRFYQRTKNFTAYADLKACLAAGGELPASASVSQTKANEDDGQDYDRNDWPHWVDSDGDCQNTRAEALIAASQIEVNFDDGETCRVLLGTWLDPFSGEVLSSAGDIDVDHIVPLKWANAHGGASWHRDMKRQFANDMDNLLVVSNSLNRAKGAQGPDQWLPPNQAYQCEYIQRFDRMVQKYQLVYQASEQAFIQAQLASCSQNAAVKAVAP
ncbi:HNH endonuclease family protein [Bowmanella yangjiangensis]|uniref:HNH endonuclease n=1 Tax=Bowmanella yangjiangensis TaxID=2811230 RepID=A0ABS3CWS8_9ALTE|nr:HNH endonuclease family protein [Bowmanella yangjiangensis]MBN7820841.1 HNH endonuclease [Bowmanella yangjiangensis]